MKIRMFVAVVTFLVVTTMLVESASGDDSWTFKMLFLSSLPATADLNNLTGISSGQELDANFERAITLWRSNGAARGPFTTAGQSYQFDVLVLRDGGNVSAMIGNFYAGVGPGGCSVLLPPFAPSRLAPILAAGVNPTKTPTVGIFDDPQFQTNTPTLLSVFQSNADHLNSPFLHLRINGGQSVGIIYVDDGFLVAGLCNERLAQARALSYGVDLLATLPIKTNDGQENVSLPELQAAVHHMTTINPDLLIFCGVQDTPDTFLGVLQQLNYSPKMVTIIPQVYGVPEDPLLRARRDYIHQTSFWSPLAEYSDPVWGSATNFSSAFYQQFGVYPTDGTVAAMLAGMSLYAQAIGDYLLRQTPPFQPPSQSDTLFYLSRAVLTDSLVGQVRFASAGNNIGEDMLLNQRFPKQFVPGLPQQLYDADGASVAVYPPRAASKRAVYPMPPWDSRQYDPSFCSEPSEIVVAVFIGLFSVATIGWMIFVLVMRKAPAIACSSPLFLLLMLLGALLIYNSIWGWMVYVTDAGCQAMVWLSSLGFGLLIISLFVKNYIIYKVFVKARSLVKYHVPLHVILGLALFILVPILVLLIVWTAVSPMQAQLYVPNPYQPAQNYTACYADSTATVFIGLIVGYIGLLILGLVALSLKLWKIDRAVLNESLHISLAVYVWSIALFVALIIVATQSVSLEVEFLIRSLCVLCGVFFGICIIMVPKVIFIRSNKTVFDISGSRSAKSSVSTSS